MVVLETLVDSSKEFVSVYGVVFARVARNRRTRCLASIANESIDNFRELFYLCLENILHCVRIKATENNGSVDKVGIVSIDKRLVTIVSRGMRKELHRRGVSFRPCDRRALYLASVRLFETMIDGMYKEGLLK